MDIVAEKAFNKIQHMIEKTLSKLDIERRDFST